MYDEVWSLKWGLHHSACYDHLTTVHDYRHQGMISKINCYGLPSNMFLSMEAAQNLSGFKTAQWLLVPNKYQLSPESSCQRESIYFLIFQPSWTLHTVRFIMPFDVSNQKRFKTIENCFKNSLR